MPKQKIRSYIKKYRTALTQDFIRASAEKITEKAVNFINQKGYLDIALYCSVQNEVATDLLIKELLALNYNIYLPVIDLQTHRSMFFAKYDLNTQLQKNRYNIPEPVLHHNQSNVIALESIDFMFIPLVGFDKNKNRLGWGQGYYDQTLRNKALYKLKTCGLAYSGQQVDNVYPEDWDIPLDYIITEKDIFY